METSKAEVSYKTTASGMVRRKPDKTKASRVEINDKQQSGGEGGKLAKTAQDDRGKTTEETWGGTSGANKINLKHYKQ